MTQVPAAEKTLLTNSEMEMRLIRTLAAGMAERGQGVERGLRFSVFGFQYGGAASAAISHVPAAGNVQLKTENRKLKTLVTS